MSIYESTQRHKQHAITVGAPDCEGVLHEDLMKAVYDGYAVEKLLPKNWELNDYSPSESLIEIADLTNGDRFWVEPYQLFYKEFAIGRKYLFIKSGARNLMDDSTRSKVILDRFDAIVCRKREYLHAVFKLIPADQEAATV